MKDKEQNLNNQNFPKHREVFDPFYEPDPVKQGLGDYDIHSIANYLVKQEVAVNGDLGPEVLSEFRTLEVAEKIIFEHKSNRQKFVDEMNA